MPLVHSKKVDLLIGLNIKSIRKYQQKTQKELATNLGITFQQFQKYETGKSRLTISLLLKLSDLLNVSVYRLIEMEYTPHTLTLHEQRISFSLSKNEVEVLKHFHNITDKKLQKEVLQIIKIISQYDIKSNTESLP